MRLNPNQRDNLEHVKRRWVPILLAIGLMSPVAAADDAEKRRYTVRAMVPELEVATQGEIELIVEAEGDYLIDKKYPATLEFKPAVGDTVLAVRKQNQTRADADYDEDGKSMTWTVEVTAKKKGAHPVGVTMKFQICDDGDCVASTSEMRLKIVVKDD
jgi:hypothetical protein